ncbi:SDR family NAD(P)-dependent oxidoreductase [Catellatospora citrea]|uniref:Short-chain dehydrogenase n=1 Tax=Catellatospora citrea TaxID=53366 RepID=A0A8J3KDY5_9ACTN|nr:SDR family NAD(P)-dependent oxidoreductase [Catellatospora citrea]RKE10688.1 short-subunit dehydrogenase [Catellatospora citrea]GIG01178.1 short-chain dehydrogenase [Catellatospora citrea]
MTRAPRPVPLEGRTAVITGAASGIGRSLAQRLSRVGCPVVLADRDAEGLKAVAADLQGEHLLRDLDVADPQAMREFAAEVEGWMPAPLGAVFNNAGVALSSTVLDASPEDDDWIHEINFWGVVRGTRAFLPILSAQDSGAIVNTSSVFGLLGMPSQSAYCAAKFAVRGFTDALRQELRGTGVRAVTVHPGGVKTNIVRNGRVRNDPAGLSPDQRAERFDAVALTSADRAAEIIHRGVDRGKARILVGPDAYFFDVVSRLAPTHYYTIVNTLENSLRRRSGAKQGTA